MTDKRSWKEIAKQEFEDIGDRPIKTSEQVKHLVNAIWATCHDEESDKKDVLSNLALLSGMASACLLDYASLLESRGREKD